MGHRLSRLTAAFAFVFFNLAFSGCAHSPSTRSPPREEISGEAKTVQPFNASDERVVSPLMWPIAKPRITQNFKPEGNGRPHDGIDISARRGTRIYAPADGRVVYAGHKYHGYGRMIVIEHSDNLATIYGHLQKLLVKSGEAVRKGSLIGLVGKTGRATAPHLHFEVRYNKVPVDPLGYMP